MENISAIVEQAAKRNSQAMAECNDELDVINERKQRLLHANRQYQIIASLKTSGGSSWKHLTAENKWKKENVLAVFLSGKIPRELKESSFQQSAPEMIRNDRDVLFARLAQDDFAHYYYEPIRTSDVYEIPRRIESNPFRVPEPLLADKEVITAVVHRYPEILILDVLPAELLDDIDVFRAYLTSKRLHKYRLDAADAMWNLVGKFSEGIRDDAKLMLEAAAGAWQQKATVYDRFSASLKDDTSFVLKLVAQSETIPIHALKPFSDRVRSDPAAVLAFVRKNGCCLKDASEAVRQNEDIVREACNKWALSLLHCEPGPTNRRLGSDKSFMLHILERLRSPGLEFGKCSRRP
jgi:hypothetical protein